jgi:uncharacterized protein with HEPN domain
MTRSPQRLLDYLRHIAEAVSRITEYTTDLDEASFVARPLIQDALIRNITRQYPDFAAQHPDLPLQRAYEMRNALSHGYFQVDVAIVWRTVKRELPALEVQIRQILARFDGTPTGGL